MAIRLLTDIIPLPERAALLARLEADHGAGPRIADLLRSGARLRKYEAPTLADIGNLTTIFESIGDVTAVQACMCQRFPVNMAYAAFAHACREGKETKPDFASLTSFIGNLERGQPAGMVTAIELPEGMMLVDGNKSAIAVHEYARRNDLANQRLSFYAVPLAH